MTHLHFSNISYGCGGYWGLPIFPERKAEALIKYAIDRGITFFDTGPNYSSGHAEQRLGRLLKDDSAKHRLTIGTKVGSRQLDNGRVVRDFTPQGIEASVYRSLKCLQLETLPLLQLHGPNPEILQDHAVSDTLLRLKEKGIVQSIGMSGDGPQVDAAIRTDYLDTIMTTFNVITRESAPQLTAAWNAGKQVLIKSPLAHLVFDNQLFRITSLRRAWYLARVLKNYRHILRKRSQLQLLKNVEGWTPAQAALRFVLDHPHVTTAVVGTCSLDHLRDNLAVLDRRLPAHVMDVLDDSQHARP